MVEARDVARAGPPSVSEAVVPSNEGNAGFDRRLSPFAAVADAVEFPYRPASAIIIIDDESVDVILNQD
jgi:hypothetical protein